MATKTITLHTYYGEQPWVAQITGTDKKYGFARRFMRGARESSKSGKTADTTLVLSDGLYQVGGGRSAVRDLGEYFLICDGQKDGQPAHVRVLVNAERALKIAALMDQGVSFDDARKQTKPSA